MTIKTRLYIWLLDRHILHVKPWEDPRRTPEDRAAWIQASPYKNEAPAGTGALAQRAER